MFQPMVDARNEAIRILETASNQVIDQMTQQIKENIDDNMKEIKGIVVDEEL